MMRRISRAPISSQSLFSKSDYTTARFKFTFPVNTNHEHYYLFYDLQRIVQNERLQFAEQYIISRLCGGYSDGLSLVAATLPFLAKADAKKLVATFSNAPRLFERLYPITRASGDVLAKDYAGRYQLALATIPLLKNTDQLNTILVRLDANHWESYLANYREWQQTNEKKSSSGFHKHT